MKKTLFIIPILIAVIVTVAWSMRLDVRFGGGMISVTLSSEAHAKEVTLTPDQIKEAALDEYTDSELIKVSETQYVIDYPGTKSRIEIGSVDKENIDFKTDITIKHWDNEVSFSLIAPAAIDSKSELTADLFADKVIATNGEWNFEYFATDPNDFNEYGGIDIVITAKEKPVSNKIYFTYDSTTVTPYYQGELNEKEIEEGASRPDHVIGSIAFYANGKGNHAIGGINYATGKVGHLYAMRSGEEWCRWSIEGDYIVLTIPDVIFNGKYPVVISPVGDTFGYTSMGSSFINSANRIRAYMATGAAGTANSISVALENFITGGVYGALSKESDDSLVAVTAEDTGTANGWHTMNFGSPPTISAIDYFCLTLINDAFIDFDSNSQTENYLVRTYEDGFPDPVTLSTGSARSYSIYCTYTPSGSGAAPDVTTGSASSIDCESFNIWGNITDNHTGTTTTVGFYYGIGGFTDNVSGAYLTDNFTLNISGLDDNTEYMVKAFAINEYGTGNGTSVNVTTLASSNPTVTTDNATDITNSTARLNATISGLDCDDADDTFWEWGLSTGNYTANYTDTTDHGNGAVYHDLSGLSANTTYYYRACARLNGGVYQCGGEKSFSTTNICPAPTELRLTILNDTQISAEWDSVDNITSYLLLVSNIDYPDDPEDTYGYAVAYSGNSTSATLEGYETDLNTYYFSLWTHCNPYSDEYVTASIGGESLEDLANSFQNIGIMLIGMIPLIFFSVMAFWRENSIMFMLAAGVSILVGFNCYDVESSAWMFGVALILWAYSIVCLIFGFMCIFKRRPAD